MTKIKIVAKIVAAAVKYIKADRDARYALLETHTSRIKAPGIGRFEFENDIVSIHSPSEDETLIVVRPFPADSGLWNGPDILPNNLKDGTFEASLNHDIVWAFAGAIAMDNNTTAADVKLWSNEVFELEQKYYAKVKVKLERRIIRRFLDWGARRYSRVKKAMARFLPVLAAAVAVGSAAGCAGCAWYFTDPEGEVEADPIVWSDKAPEAAP